MSGIWHHLMHVWFANHSSFSWRCHAIIQNPDGTITKVCK